MFSYRIPLTVVIHNVNLQKEGKMLCRLFAFQVESVSSRNVVLCAKKWNLIEFKVEYFVRIEKKALKIE